MHLLEIGSKDIEWLGPLTDEFRARHNCPEGQVLDGELFCYEYGIASIKTEPAPDCEGLLSLMWFEFASEADLLLFVMRYKK